MLVLECASTIDLKRRSTRSREIKPDSFHRCLFRSVSSARLFQVWAGKSNSIKKLNSENTVLPLVNVILNISVRI